MSVLIVLPDLNLGGAQRVLIQIANGLARKGENVRLFLFSGRGPLRGEIDEAVNLLVHSEEKLSLSLQLSAGRKLFTLLRDPDLQSVLTTLYQTNVLVSTIHLLARSKAKLFLREANFVSLQWPQSRFYPLIARIGPPLYRRAEAVIVPAKDQVTDIVSTLNLDQGKVICIGNPVLPAWIDEKAAEALPSALEKALGSPVIITVGRLEPQKGHMTLLKAFAKHADKHEGHLLFIGEGHLRSDLEAATQNFCLTGRVHLPGLDTNPFKYLAKADLFVLSSRHEGLPNVLIQAMAMGLRCVSTDCKSGPRELLEDGTYGRLVPVDDVDEMADAILAALDDPPINLPSSWREKYAEEHVLERYKMLMTRT